MKGRSVNCVLLGVDSSGMGRVNWEGEGGQISLLYFIYWYKNRIMKPVEIVFRKEEEVWGRMMMGLNITKVHYKHIWKCHNETPLHI
jgi:hypothetical protein